MRIDASTIIVTGASSGIGAALAPQLAAAGARVGIVARRADRLESVLAECRAASPDSEMWVADLSDLDDAARVARACEEQFGHVDVLVNNAGMAQMARDT